MRWFWEALGASWALLGAPRALVCFFSRFSVFWESFVVFCEFFVVVDCFFIVLIVLCWFGLFSVVQPIFKSCQRAERRERSERCEAPVLLLVIFRYFLLFLVVFKSSALALHASTTLICIRASRSLLRQVPKPKKEAERAFS